MAENNNLKILITGSLNIGKSIGEINTQVKALEKKIKGIKLNIEINDKVTKTLSDFSKAMDKHKAVAQDFNKVMKEEKTIVKESDGTIKEKIRQHLKSGEIIDKEIKKVNQQTKATQQQTAETRKLIVEREKLANKIRQTTNLDAQGNKTGGSITSGDKFKNTTVNYNAKDEVTSQRTVENIRQQEVAVEKLKHRLAELNNAGIITNSTFSRMNQALNSRKTEADLNQITQALNRVDNSAKAKEKTKELEHQLKLYQQQAQINVQNLQRRYGNAIGDDGARALNTYLGQVNRLTSATPNLTRQMQSLAMNFREISANVNASTSHVMSFGQQLQVAMSRIPVWMTGMTLFYAPLRGLQDALRQIIEIDSQLTVLERVSNGQQDINHVFQESIRLASELGNKITEVNEGMINFTKSGFRGEDLTKMTEVATLMANVSDLSVDDAASTVTAAMKGFGIEAENTMHIVDALNETDNNYAISTDQLSQAVMKATGAANTFGVSMEALLGHTTAIGEVTRESGNIIGNSLKTIYSRITTMSTSEELLNSVGVSIRDMSGNLLDVEDILGTLAGKWSSLSSEQQQALGVQLAGRYQLSRFLVLMQQYDQALAAQETAINSSGSAYRENEAFLDSYQAKLNQLSNAWTTLSTTMGESVLGSGIVVVSESLIGIANASKLVVDSVGLLPAIFGIAGTAFLAFNSHTRNSIMQQGLLSTALVRTGDSMSIATGRSRLLQSQLYNLTLATRATGAAVGVMGTAIKGVFSFLGRAFLPIAGFMALGSAISFATNKLVEHKQAQKDAQEEIDKLTDTYANNELQIESLVSKYEKLKEQVDKGSLTANDSEYLGVQQELYELLPSVAESVDEKGQAHLRSADAIRQELGYLEKLAKVDAEEFINDFHSKLSDLNSQIDKTQSKLAEIQSRQDNDYSGILPFFGLREKAQLDDMANSIIGQRDIEAKLEERKRLFQELGQSYATYYGVQNQITEEDQKHIDTIVEKNAKLLDSKKGTEELQNQIKGYIGAVGEIRTVTGSAFSTDEIIRLISVYDNAGQVFHNMSEAIKDGETDWDSYRDELESIGIKGKDLETIIDNLKNGNYGLIDSIGEGIAYFDEYGNIVEDVATDVDKLAESYDNAVSSISDLNGFLEELSESHELSADSIGTILEKYPELLAYLGDEVALTEAIKNSIQEEEQVAKKAIASKLLSNETFYKSATVQNSKYFQELSKAYGEDLKGAKTLAQAKQQVEQSLIKTLSENWQKYYQVTADGMLKLRDAVADNLTRAAMAGDPEAARILSEMNGYNSKIKEIADGFASITMGAADFNTSISDAGKSTSKASKEYENATYVTDKFKQALEKLNLELEKQRAIQAKFPDYSKEYQSALKSELGLLEQKKKLLEDQSKALDQQIKSGKNQQTGIITTKSSVATGGSNADTIWNYFKSKGFSDAIVSGIMGNLRLESNLNPNALNKSSGAFGIAQWLGGRKTGLQNYAKSIGSSANNLMTQLDYLWKELNSTEKRTMNWINSNPNTSASTMAAMFDKLFERSEGTHIPQRQKYANQYLSQYGGIGGSASASNISKEVADNLSSIDQAKSELLSLQQDVLDIESQISQLEVDIVNAQLSGFEHRKSNYDKVLENGENRLKKYAESSQQYRDEIERQQTSLSLKQAVNDQEIAFLKGVISQGNLSAIAVAELNEKLHELGSQRNTMIFQQQEMALQKVNSAMKEYEENIDDVNYQLDRNNSILSTVSEHSSEWYKIQKDQLNLYQSQAKLILNQRNELKELLATENLSVQMKKELSETLEDLSVKYWELQNSIIGLNKSMRQQRENIADDIISQMKKFHEIQRDIKLEQFDKDRELEDEAYENLKEKYQDDLDEYRKYINNKIRMMEDLRAEDDFEEDIGDLEEELQQLQDRINILSPSASQNATPEILKQVRDLEKQRDELLDQIAEKREDREYELKRQNYERMIEDEQDRVDEQLEIEEVAYKKRQKQLDKERKAIEKHYEQILDDEKFWAEKREQIIAGNIDFIETELQEMYDKLNLQKDSVEELDLSYQNVLNTLYEMKKVLSEMGDIPNLDKSDPNSGKGSGSITSGWFADRLDAQNLANILMSDYGALNAEVFEDGDGYKVKGDFVNYERAQAVLNKLKDRGLLYRGSVEQELPNGDKGETYNPQDNGRLKTGWFGTKEEADNVHNILKRDYSPIKSTVFKDSEGYKIQADFAEYDRAIAVFNKLKERGLIRVGDVQKYHTGGIVGGKGNRLTELANKLFNLKPNEQTVVALQNELFAPERNMPNFFNNLKNLTSSLISPNVELASSPINIQFNVDKMYGTQKEAKTFADKVVNNLQNRGRI